MDTEQASVEKMQKPVSSNYMKYFSSDCSELYVSLKKKLCCFADYYESDEVSV